MLTAFTTYCGIFFICNKWRDAKTSRAVNSFVNATFLSFFSIITFSTLLVHGTTMTEHLLEKPEQTWLTDYTIGYFAADLVLGHVYGGLNLFAGYVHHSVYLALLLFLRTQNQSNLIYLCLPFEIPTMIQSIHTIDKHRYYPILFGSTFVAFRLIGNVAVIYLVYRVSLLYSIIATLMLATHIAWFTDWTKKQISRRITSQPIVGV